jgi:aminobenzoyl-glutamate transport protein
MSKKKQSFLARMLNVTEKAGNALPHPATLFLIFALLALVFSWLAWLVDWSAIHPGTKEEINPVNLLSTEGLHRILLEMVDNYTGFAPLGIVMVALLGIGIAEKSGLISALIRLLILSAPQRMLTFVIVFSGILSNIASDVGYVLLIPLAGIIFQSIGRNPIAGMAAAFAGVSGGFTANIVLGTTDPLLAGLSEEAANIVDPAYRVNPTANYYFMVVSTFVIAITGTWVSEKIVFPRLGDYKPVDGPTDNTMEELSAGERSGLRWAGITALALLGIALWGLIPEDGFFRGPEGDFLGSPLIEGVVAILFLGAGLCGLAYGIAAKTIRSDADVMKGMTDSMKSIAAYLVLVFFAAQFVAYFKWSNLGMILAIKGADGLMAANLGIIPLMLLFILLSAAINMLMGSASAKWAIMAPVFIPMFMFMGYSPELSQVVFRIGDSVTNVISPMMSFFALIIAFFQKYDEKAGIGTIIATMLPYTLAFLIVWSILLIAWILLGIPLGPGAGLYYQLP